MVGLPVAAGEVVEVHFWGGMKHGAEWLFGFGESEWILRVCGKCLELWGVGVRRSSFQMTKCYIGKAWVPRGQIVPGCE